MPLVLESDSDASHGRPTASLVRLRSLSGGCRRRGPQRSDGDASAGEGGDELAAEVPRGPGVRDLEPSEGGAVLSGGPRAPAAALHAPQGLHGGVGRATGGTTNPQSVHSS